MHITREAVRRLGRDRRAVQRMALVAVVVLAIVAAFPSTGGAVDGRNVVLPVEPQVIRPGGAAPMPIVPGLKPLELERIFELILGGPVAIARAWAR